MARPCKWCGRFFSNEEEVREHERLHRDVDRWASLEQAGMDSAHYWTFEDSREGNVNVGDVYQSDTIGESNHLHVIVDKNDEKNTALFQCTSCGKQYKWKKDLDRHNRAEHTKQTHSCTKCQKVFKYNSDKFRHEKNCNEQRVHRCSVCGKLCSTAYGLRRHVQVHDKQPMVKVKEQKPRASTSTAKSTRNPGGRPSRFRCRRCSEVFENRSELFLHGMSQHYVQSGGALQPRPWGPGQATPFDDDQALREVYNANAPLILENHRRGPIRNIYNFPVTNEIDLNELMRLAWDVYNRQQRAFRLNLVFGVILQNRETGRYRYFVPYTNTGVFDRPIYISKRDDLQRLRRQLEEKDLLQELLNQRPDTKWVPVLITNVHFVVNETSYPLGQGDLPEYLMKKTSLCPLVKNQHTGKFYKDNLCAFRCLALHRGYDIRSLDTPTNQLFSQWTNETTEHFRGLSFEDFPQFETLFQVNLEVYTLQEDGFARSVYKSRGKHDSTMYLNLYENHLSYIRSFSQYAQKYQCGTCDRHFKLSWNLHRHQKSCSNKTIYVFPGGFHQTRNSIFDQLDQYEIHVPEDERTFPWFLCYDFEALLQKIVDCPTDSLQWTAKHVPVSVSICSNVEGYTDPICFVNVDQDKLVEAMVNHMEEVAARVSELTEEKWGWVLDAIDRKIEEDDSFEKEISEESEDGMEDAEAREGMEDAEAREGVAEKSHPLKSHPLKKIYGYLEGYMLQVPVIGFNSAKYDLNLIKRCLAKHLHMHEESRGFVIKKNNAYTCIATDTLKFLDMTQFLAPGCSYSVFLKAFDVKQQKGYFPYEWFDDITKLQLTSLPPHDAFYSQLKGSNISIDEYKFCENIWIQQGMTTFEDFLVWYNNLDVTGFVAAVEQFQRFYFAMGVDVLKSAISVPSVARQLLFKTATKKQAKFALFDENNKDLYQAIKRNIVGGPSIIFTRHQCAGKTSIRGEKLCKSILGFDANALYLHAIGQPMPVGPFVRRFANNDFRPELRDRYMSAYYWMDWIAYTQGLEVQHRLNFGREVIVGKYPVDGYVQARQPGERATILQYHGCYWHGHLCENTRNIKDKKWLESRHAKYQRTLETTAYLRKEHDVIEMWGCQFKKYCSEHPQIYNFIDSMRPGFFREHKGKGKITPDLILQGVDSGTLFGMVEVDIEVPKEWPDYFCHSTLTPYDYFKEMSPLFCTTDIPFESVGDHMQAHIWNHQLSDKPRRLLVGGMRARQILIATPLLKWYLDHGMIVTKIYQVVEFQAQRCFQDFVSDVTHARRQGDIDPAKAIIADTMKVIGNSAYGSLIMDKSKHREIQYVQGENETCLKVNEPRFRNLDCLDDAEQYYEVEMAKRKIRMDLPIQLGYFILQYAKLRMLEFYYDFMDVYVDRSDFEYCEMDTDSAYMAISGRNLNDIIRPEMRDKYEKGLTGYCSDIEIEADAKDHWFPRNCCSKHAKIDKRTPGLFKLEYQGDEMIGLCSKTYIVRKVKLSSPSSTQMVAIRLLNKARRQKPRRRTHLAPRRFNEYKFSSKGISKRHLKAPMVKFRRVLMSSRPESGVNRGFRVRNNTIFTYTQERRGFSYLYCKRKVLDDGIHTIPLDITLCPLSPEERDVDDQELIDLLANNFEDC